MKVSHEMIVTEGDPAEIFPDVPSEPKFDEAESDFLEAEAIEKIGVALLEKRPLPEALRERTFVYLSQRKGGKSHGKAVLGRCRRPRGLLARFCDTDFIVTVSADHVAAARLTRFQMEALVFHELCHAAYDPEDGCYL